MPTTIASVLRRTAGFAPGVPQTRALLVFAWIAYQSVRLTNGLAGEVTSPLWIVPHAVIPALFAVLGFCLAQAAAERPILPFMLDRAEAVGPAVVVVVLVSALVMGPLMTSNGLGNYVRDPFFAQYFLNLVGFPQFLLPGVFEFNDYAAVVNEALWLTPCFFIVALCVAATMRSRAPRVVTLIPAFLALAIYAAGEVAGALPSPAGSVVRYSYLTPALAAIFAGQCGAAAFAWRERLTFGWLVIAIAAIAGGAMAFISGPGFIEIPGAPLLIALAAIAGALAAITRVLPGAWLARRAAPILHGAMLFSFPLQQLVVSMLPGQQAALTNLIFALPVAVAAAWALQWALTRVGLARDGFGPDLSASALPAAEPRRPFSWRGLVRQAAEGLGVALVVAAVGLAVILLTIAALQSDPVGV